MTPHDHLETVDGYTITPADVRTVIFRLGQIEQELRNTQALVARTYERTYEWERAVHEARADAAYNDAYEGEPLVTVRVATINQAELLCNRALASVLRQTYTNWEVIVIGDACTDDTAERIAAIGDPRIRFINLAFRGPYPADQKGLWYVGGIPPMNAALDEAKGAWIAPLDHDDSWHDDHLEVLVAEAKRTRAEVVYGKMAIVDAKSEQHLGEMGEFPPRRGEFGFLSAIHHAGLSVFRYDMNCRFADEPGDWNVARRMWDSGVRFHFVDRVVSTAFFLAKHGEATTTEAKMIVELRNWAAELQQARDYWNRSADLAWQETQRLQEMQARALIAPPPPTLMQRVSPVHTLPFRLARNLKRRATRLRS